MLTYLNYAFREKNHHNAILCLAYLKKNDSVKNKITSLHLNDDFVSRVFSHAESCDINVGHLKFAI